MKSNFIKMVIHYTHPSIHICCSQPFLYLHHYALCSLLLSLFIKYHIILPLELVLIKLNKSHVILITNLVQQQLKNRFVCLFGLHRAQITNILQTIGINAFKQKEYTGYQFLYQMWKNCYIHVNSTETFQPMHCLLLTGPGESAQ